MRTSNNNNNKTNKKRKETRERRGTTSGCVGLHGVNEVRGMVRSMSLKVVAVLLVQTLLSISGCGK
jgi:hypothetical protein